MLGPKLTVAAGEARRGARWRLQHGISVARRLVHRPLRRAVAIGIAGRGETRPIALHGLHQRGIGNAASEAARRRIEDVADIVAVISRALIETVEIDPAALVGGP